MIDHIFLDSSVLFSAAQMRNGLHPLWEMAEHNHCRLFSSRYAIEKAKRNLQRKWPKQKLERLLAPVQIVLEADPRTACPVQLPKAHEAILMSAIVSGADYLVTADLKEFESIKGQMIQGVKVCSVKEYLEERADTESL
jgi:hypothetical protein